MAQITRGIDQVEVWGNWYEDSLDYFVAEAKEKGIEIGQEACGRTRYRPAISFSGFWSQGDGLAFDADIHWPVFFDAHPELKTEYVNWYLALSANPDYMRSYTARYGRNSNSMHLQSDGDQEVTLDAGFFAGTDTVVIEFEHGFEGAVLYACEDEAYRMYKALEEEYEAQLEYEVEQAKEALIEEYKEPICRMLWPMMTGGEADEDEVDLDDLEELGLIDRKGVTKKGLKVLA